MTDFDSTEPGGSKEIPSLPDRDPRKMTTQQTEAWIINAKKLRSENSQSVEAGSTQTHSQLDDETKPIISDEQEWEQNTVQISKPKRQDSKPNKGLTSKGGKKLPISDEDIHLDDLSIVIGPLYVMNWIVEKEFLKELPKAPLNPFIEYAHQSKDEYVTDGEIISGQIKRMNQALINTETMRVNTSPSRFYKNEKLKGRTVKLVRKRFKIKRLRTPKIHSKKNSKRGLPENRKLYSFLVKLLPYRFRPLSLKLNKISSEEVPIKDLPKVIKSVIKFSHLTKFQTKKRISFKILNTTKPLDIGSIPVVNQPRIVLQWGRAKPSIRNIRVDGVSSKVLTIENRLPFLAPYFTMRYLQILFLWSLICFFVLFLAVLVGMVGVII